MGGVDVTGFPRDFLGRLKRGDSSACVSLYHTILHVSLLYSTFPGTPCASVQARTRLSEKKCGWNMSTSLARNSGDALPYHGAGPPIPWSVQEGSLDQTHIALPPPPHTPTFPSSVCVPTLTTTPTLWRREESIKAQCKRMNRELWANVSEGASCRFGMGDMCYSEGIGEGAEFLSLRKNWMIIPVKMGDRNARCTRFRWILGNRGRRIYRRIINGDDEFHVPRPEELEIPHAFARAGFRMASYPSAGLGVAQDLIMMQPPHLPRADIEVLFHLHPPALSSTSPSSWRCFSPRHAL